MVETAIGGGVKGGHRTNGKIRAWCKPEPSIRKLMALSGKGAKSSSLISLKDRGQREG